MVNERARFASWRAENYKFDYGCNKNVFIFLLLLNGKIVQVSGSFLEQLEVLKNGAFVKMFI